jgi:ABC-type spermidine/putrescine transport system permease subunit I
MFAPLSLVPSSAKYAELLGDRFYVRVFLNTVLLGLAVAAGTDPDDAVIGDSHDQP